jgi:hypothetical protein
MHSFGHVNLASKHTMWPNGATARQNVSLRMERMQLAFCRDHAQIDMACTLFADTLDKGKRDDEIFSQEQAVAFRKPICLHQLLSEERNNPCGINEAFPINACHATELC